MGVGSFLATKENIEMVKKLSWAHGRPRIIEMGMSYYQDNPKDSLQIANNLRLVGLPADESKIKEVQKEIVAHYYEKLFALVKRYEAVWICRNRVLMGDSLEPFYEAQKDKKAVFVAQSHFGATYLLASVLMCNGFDINTVGNFPEPIGSMLKQSTQEFANRYNTGKVNLINLAEPQCDAPMAMLKCLVTQKIVSNVFDENNEFCRPVPFMGTTVYGGSGMDKILNSFNDNRVVIVTPFLIRTGDDSFRYEVDRHYLKEGDIIESFYKSLEKRVIAYPAQWYFLAELEESFIDKRKNMVLKSSKK
jgi:lauroyl/myristoyl acyltransferase